MTKKATILSLIIALAVGAMIGAALTRYRNRQYYLYSWMVNDKIYCYGAIRWIQQLDRMEIGNVRRDMELRLARRVIRAEQAATANDKVGQEARELLKLVADHRKDPKYIEQENAARAWLAGGPPPHAQAPNP